MDGAVDPTKERFALFKALPSDQPIHMLNLVRLRAEAAYPDGRKASGREAYRAYARESGPVFARLGGRQIWIGDDQHVASSGVSHSPGITIRIINTQPSPPTIDVTPNGIDA